MSFLLPVSSRPFTRNSRARSLQASAPGALTIDAICQEGAFVIDNISFYNDAKVGTELTAEADWKRRGYYIGPQVCTMTSSC